jgi:DNA-binding transcriptional regulator YiaG
MTALFRNVDASPDDPVEEWPLEAIQATLERGSLKHWRPLAAAIQAQPWGPVSRAVEEVLTYTRPYGVAEAMEKVIAQTRRSAEAAERTAVASDIQRLIGESGLSRQAFASGMGTSPSRLSTYASGKVVPSATLFLRMQNLAESGSARPQATLPRSPELWQKGSSPAAS